jgi:CRISPR-associated endoribonuclease Cas6
MIDSFIQNFIIGTFQSQKIEIFGENIKTVFYVRQVEALPEPDFTGPLQFISLSPVVLSEPRVRNNKMVPEYLRYYDDINLANRLLNENLKNKYALLHNMPGEEKNVWLEWDRDYITQKEKQKKKLTILQTIKSGTKQQTKVVGNILPFKLTGDTDLIKTGYECGFGDMNSMGFGMAEIISKSTW